MSRMTRVLATALAALLISLTQFGHNARASGGFNTLQTVALHRQNCATTNVGLTVGTARFSADDQGGGNLNPNGIEIRISVTAGMPRSAYSASVLGDSCQVLFRGGTLKTDDSGRGDLDFHVLGTLVPSGTSLRVQLAAPVDVITSDPTSGA